MRDSIKLTKLTECAGCGAKVGAGELQALLGDLQVHTDENLLVGFDKSDDASVYKISEELAIVQTVDFFPPIADDPYRFGAIAAANALSDVYAMGGEPKLALNIMMVPEDMDKAYVHEILRGGYAKVYEAGAMITTPGCGLCCGRAGGILTDNEVVVATNNRNFLGRMGTSKVNIYLASPVTAANCAIAGKIV